MSNVNRHRVIDTLAITTGSMFFPGYFREKVESVSLEAHLEGVHLQMPPIEGENTYELTAQTLVGELHPALRLVQWKGAAYPTLIYHHGAMEIPFDYGFRNIFPLDKMAIDANLFLIRAPYHNRRKDFLGGMVATENWLAMKAVSMRVIEETIRQVRSMSERPILVGGTSLGGFITNLHHIHFNSADVYTPLLAGLAMHDAFLYSVYSKAVDASAKARPETMKQLFDFQPSFDTSGHSHDNVFPLLSRHDAIIRFDVQKASYSGLEVAVIDKGHTTGALAYDALRDHMLKHLA
jgi:hypothetical protein